VTMGEIHMAESQIDRALEAYSRALSIDPNNFEARLKRANLYMELNNIKDAVADLDQAAKINPYKGDIYLLRGRCYEMLGNIDEARQDEWRAKVFANR